jgi:hypothetical protein
MAFKWRGRGDGGGVAIEMTDVGSRMPKSVYNKKPRINKVNTGLFRIDRR